MSRRTDAVQDWPPSLREEFEERAAILEFDAGFERDVAEEQAVAIVLRAHGMSGKPLDRAGSG